MSASVASLRPGQSGRITSLDAVGPMRRRLMDMGVTPGEEIRLVKVAPLGDPLEVSVRSYHLSLRKKEAEGIAIEVLG